MWARGSPLSLRAKTSYTNSRMLPLGFRIGCPRSGADAQGPQLPPPLGRDPVRGPGWAPDLHDTHLADPGLLLEPVGDILADELHAGARRGGEGDLHPDRPGGVIQAVDQAEL